MNPAKSFASGESDLALEAAIAMEQEDLALVNESIALWSHPATSVGAELPRNLSMSKLMRRYFATFLSPYFLDAPTEWGARSRFVKKAPSLRSWFSRWSSRPDDDEVADAGQGAFARLLAQAEPTAMQSIRLRIENNLKNYTNHLAQGTQPDRPITTTAFANYLRGMIVNQLVSVRRKDARRAGLLGMTDVDTETASEHPNDIAAPEKQQGEEPDSVADVVTLVEEGRLVSDDDDGSQDSESGAEDRLSLQRWRDAWAVESTEGKVMQRQFIAAYRACLNNLGPTAQNVLLETGDLDKGKHFSSSDDTGSADEIRRMFGMTLENYRKTRQRGFLGMAKCLESKGFGPDSLSRFYH